MFHPAPVAFSVELIDELFDVFIQGIKPTLHHENDGDQLFTAAMIQFFEWVYLPLL